MILGTRGNGVQSPVSGQWTHISHGHVRQGCHERQGYSPILGVAGECRIKMLSAEMEPVNSKEPHTDYCIYNLYAISYLLSV